MTLKLFGNSFIWVRNEFILPLVSYQLKENDFHLPKNLKEALSYSVKDTSILTENVYKTTNNDLYYKAIYMEIEKFYSKTIIQFLDASCSHKCSTLWNYVSWYYCSFFLATTLLRITQKGNIYITKSDNIDGIDNATNYFFQFNPDGSILVEKSKGKSHESLWTEFSAFLKELIKKSKKDSDEQLILKKIHSFFDTYGNIFPSTIRNELNYTPESALNEFYGNYSFINLSQLEYILTITPLKKDPITKKIEALSYICAYFLKFLTHLYKDLEERRYPRKNFIQKHREKYIDKRTQNIALQSDLIQLIQ